jgi:hypothetical protein
VVVYGAEHTQCTIASIGLQQQQDRAICTATNIFSVADVQPMLLLLLLCCTTGV